MFKLTTQCCDSSALIIYCRICNISSSHVWMGGCCTCLGPTRCRSHLCSHLSSRCTACRHTSWLSLPCVRRDASDSPFQFLRAGIQILSKVRDENTHKIICNISKLKICLRLPFYLVIFQFYSTF